jgi:hypothetical protein
MLKQLIALIVFSVAIIFSTAYVQQGVHWLIDAHEWVSVLLTHIFSTDDAGTLARGLIALLSIPLLVGLLPTTIYWIIRKTRFPYFMQIVWIVWLVQAGALVTLYKAF